MSAASYRCNVCEKVVERKSRKLWIKSYCERMQRWARLYRVKRVKP